MMICPKCGCTDDIRVEALVLIKLGFYAAEPIPQSGHLYEWNGDSDTICGQCGHNAKAEDFGEPSVAHISDEDVADDEVTSEK